MKKSLILLALAIFATGLAFAQPCSHVFSQPPENFCDSTKVWVTGPAGTYHVTATGFGSYTLTNNGTFQVTVTDNGSGNGTATVTNSSGCVTTGVFAVFHGPTVSITGTSPTCGQSNGSATVSASGGTGQYSYLWSNNQTSATATNLAAGTYTVTVTNIGFNACTATATATLTCTPSPCNMWLQGNPTPTTCNQANGSINLTANSATGMVTYDWNDVQGNNNSQNRSNLPAGTYYVTATDGTGCTASTSVVVSNQPDQTAPQITCPPTQTVAANANCEAVLGNYASMANASDNCGGTPTKTQVSPNMGTMLQLGSHSVTLKATDAAGNSSTCAFNVQVVDQTPPTITCPANTTINSSASACSAVFSYGTSCTDDNCGTPTLTLTSGQQSGSTFPVGTTTNVWRATDAANNSATCSFMVTVVDQIKPTIMCPANIVQSATSNQCGANVTFSNATATDNCAIQTLVKTTGLASGSNFPVGQLNVVTYQATDNAGNTATCSFTVTVSDNTAPVITCPSNQTTVVNANCSASLPNFVSLAAASDNCGNMAKSQFPAAGTSVNLGTTQVLLTAADAAGNTTTCYFTVQVTDPTPPTVVCKNATVNLNPGGSTSIAPADVFQSGSDNCGTVNMVSVSPSTFTCGNAGANSVTLTVNDGHGNTSTCNATVTVICTPVNPGCNLIVSTTVERPTCNQSDGTISIDASGGTSPYNYDWSDINGTVNIQNRANLYDGAYTVTITDATGCSKVKTFELICKPVTTTGCPLAAFTNATNATCGQANGSIDLTVTGGTSPYAYVWNNSFTGQDPSGLSAGNYSVTVTDGAGTTATQIVTIANIGTPQTWYADNDNDGFGSMTTTISSCSQPSGYIAVTGDCNDSDGAIHPGAQEICGNATDEDCDGVAQGCGPNPPCAPNGNWVDNNQGILYNEVVCLSDLTGVQTILFAPPFSTNRLWDSGSGQNATGDHRVIINELGPQAHSLQCLVNGVQTYICWSWEVVNCVSPTDDPDGLGNNVNVSPNPSFSDFLVELATGKYTVVVSNSLGQTVKVLTATGDFNLEAGDLPAGVYALAITDDTGLRVVKQIVKSN
ncbi:MAG: HYR domain-containing protein [bacterium]|nr:HYR domain-containing protein [bacterium]